MRLQPQFGQDEECIRICSTLKQLSFYQQAKYRYDLPARLDVGALPEEIAAAVKREYVESEYRLVADELLRFWDAHELDIARLRKTFPRSLRNEYAAILTKYGTRGSYDSLTGSIFLNFRNSSVSKLLGIALHEIIHISIEPLVARYHVRHWRKERLVDLIGNQYFRDLREPQKIPEDVSAVDEAFASLYPDLVDVARLIGEEPMRGLQSA